MTTRREGLLGMADNMGGAVGRLPAAAIRRRMIELMERLP